jgi:AcrR family transcriptional regulator
MARRADHTREELHRMALDAAREIADAEGLRGIKARKIMDKIGYTVGTLYQLFDDLDDLIVHMNAETLDALYETCSSVSFDSSPEISLRELANRYIRYTNDHPRLWNALLEHQLPEGKEMPEWYDARVMRLLALVAKTLAPFFREGEEDERLHEARLLWASLYGITSLESAGKIGKHETSESMVDSLIRIHLTSLQERETTQPRFGAR